MGHMLNFDNSVTFIAGKEPPVALRNFWAPENGFVWSTGKWCEVTFPFDSGARPATGIADLMLDFDVFKFDSKLLGQNVFIYLNGIRIGNLYCSKRITAIFPFDAKILLKAENVLVIDTPESAQPDEYGVPDSRSLGLQLFSVQIRKVG